MANEFNIKTTFDQRTIFTMLPAKGEKGDPGRDGADGQSAYIIAQQHGFPGTEAEWEQLMTETYENAQTAADAAAEARRVSADVQDIVDQGLGPYYYDKGEIDTMVGDLSISVNGKANASDVYTKNQISSNYYTKSDVNTRLADKADISDVSSLLTVVTVTDSASFASGDAKYFYLAVTAPSGYYPIGIIGATTSHSACFLSQFYYDSTNENVVLRAKYTSTNATTITVTAYVLCVKTIT